MDDILALSRPTGADPSALLNQFLFSANLQTQDLTGDPMLSESAPALLKELAGTPVKETIILCLLDTSSDDPLPEGFIVGRHASGLPLAASATNSEDESADFLPYTVGFLHATAPLDANQDILCTEVILDAEILPLPDEELDATAHTAIARLIDEAIELARHMGRKHIQMWLREPEEPSTLHAAFIEHLTNAQFEHVYTDAHGYIPQGAIPPEDFTANAITRHDAASAILGTDVSVVTYRDQQPPHELVDSLIELFDQGDHDVPTGNLAHTPRPWTPARLELAHRITCERGDQVLSTAFIVDGRAIAVTDIARPAFSDAHIAEQTFTIVHRAHRGTGLGKLIKQCGLARAQHQWPEVTQFYCDLASTNQPMAAINHQLGFIGGKRTVVYQTSI